MKTFGINALAELLEKDRQTVVRALRGTPADAKERGQPRWKMATAVAALERHRRANDGGNSGTAGASTESLAFDRAFDALKALPTLAARRAAAVKMIPALHAMVAAVRQRGRDAGEDWDITGIRGDRVFELALSGFQAPCEWSHDETWANINIDDDPDAE